MLQRLDVRPGARCPQEVLSVRSHASPYLTDEPRCSQYSQQLVRIGSWKQLGSLDEVKWWVANKICYHRHAGLRGLLYYEQGIYSAAYGAFMGNHAVSIVGFSESDRYWICKNSWGSFLGQSGWFRISYTADTGFGSYGYYGIDFASSPQPPNAPAQPSGPAKCTAGFAYSYATSATDPGNDRVQYTFDWGDGTASKTDFVDSGKGANATHIWSPPAGSQKAYYVRAQATNSKGLSSGWSSYLAVQIINQSNRAPDTPSIPSGPTSGKENTYYSFSTSAKSTDGDRVKYTFDWGDG